MKRVLDHGDGTRTCTACEKRLPLEQFDIDRSATGGRRSHCKPCRSEKMKAWYAANRERQVERQRERFERNREAIKERDRRRYAADPTDKRERALRWARENPEKSRDIGHRRRARENAAPTIRFTQEQLAARLAFYGNLCWLCREPAEAIDHVKPITKGGWHCLANLRPICRSCNSSKHARWPFPVRAGAWAA